MPNSARQNSTRSYRTIGFALILSGLVLAAVCRAQQPASESAPSPVAAFERAIAEAEAALRENEMQVAESRYRSALLEGWLLLGDLEIEEGNLRAAKDAFRRAANATVESRRPRTSLALVQLELKEATEALGLLRDIVLAHPTDPDARRLLAQALAASGRMGEAVQELEQLRALAPDDMENAFLLATAYLRQDKPEAAEPLFAELSEKRPFPQTWVLIGRILRDFGNYEGARAALDKALAMDPRARRAHYYLGSIDLLDQGRGMLEEAMSHFKAELEVAPEDPISNLYLGIGLVENRRYEQAIVRLEAADRLGASPRDAAQFLGRSYLALGRNSDAVTALSRALDLAEGDPLEISEEDMTDLGESQIASIHYQLALALRRSGDEVAAGPHFEASKRYSAQLAESSRELLDRYLENETRETSPGSTSFLRSSPMAALSAADRRNLADRIGVALTQSYLNLGVLLTRSEHHARAAELFEQAALLRPNFPKVQYSLGAAHFNAGQFERAAAPLARAFEGSPGDANLRHMLALTWLNSGSYEGAATLLRDDVERATNGPLQYAYGLALVRSGRAAAAEAVFADLLARNADWPELNVVLGQAHAQQDDYDSAIEFLTRAIKLNPRVAEAHRTLGDIYLRQGKLDEAESELRSELISQPADTRALYTLAVVLDLNRKTAEARSVLEALLKTEPRLADARYLLGKILLAQGDAERAVEQLASAAGLSPEDPNIHYQLGQALQKLGRTEEARAAFDLFRRLKDEQRDRGGT